MARGRAAGYDDQREAILAHAARLFAQRGYMATSMNQVAEASGLSKATLYHYFKDKYTLLVQIAEGHVATLEAMVQRLEVAQQAPAEHLRALIEEIIRTYAGAQDAHRVLTEDVRFLEPEDRARVLGTERRVVEGFARAIAAYQPGHAQAGLDKPLTMLLFGMVNWLFTWMRPDGPLTHQALAPLVADLFLGGVPAVRLGAEPALATAMASTPSPVPGARPEPTAVPRSSRATAEPCPADPPQP